MLRNSILLLFFLLWVAVTHERELRPAPGRVSLPQAARGKAQYCRRQTCGTGAKAGVCRRELSPRVLDAPKPSSNPADGYWYSPSNYGYNVDKFVRGEVAKLFSVPNGIVRIDKEDVSSQIAYFKDRPTSLAMLGFCGCIGLIVMSKQAVWMVHIYEADVVRSEENFHKSIALILSGRRSQDMYYGLWDLNDDVFAPDQEPVAVIFGPGTKNGFYYKSQMDTIDFLVRKTIAIAPEWVGYDPAEGSDEYKADYNCMRSSGKVLAQYQPSNPGWLGPSKAEARIWIEGNSWTYKKSWSPQSNQIHKQVQAA
ncbi:hypothetical protein LY78DRAFT_649533 [Colletotrichum sublineola]|uniref:Uncharacterized protein n=1 Tax=Colletotrichum sublineola TaxID=1173701 RepID=A0A066WW44_COLSU|nr:hypothetical protein LY78DRAFT_649533 [Colletotrichum sublineola]KDN60912.1 hypothetical protein CSUB01_10988 [Colletotrichum sublineola]